MKVDRQNEEVTWEEHKQTLLRSQETPVLLFEKGQFSTMLNYMDTILYL